MVGRDRDRAKHRRKRSIRGNMGVRLQHTRVSMGVHCRLIRVSMEARLRPKELKLFRRSSSNSNSNCRREAQMQMPWRTIWIACALAKNLPQLTRVFLAPRMDIRMKSQALGQVLPPLGTQQQQQLQQTNLIPLLLELLPLLLPPL